MKTKRVALLIGIAVVVVVVILAIALTGGNTSAGAARSTVPPVAVEVSPVVPDTIAESIEAVGTIGAKHDVEVSSETAGRVKRVLVNVGDMVRAGDVLVAVDDELKTIAVEQARAQLLAAETNTAKAQKDLARTEKLFAAGDVADVELEGMRLALRSAEAQEKGAAVNLRYTERQLADTRIKAPVSGSVASRKVEVGEMVAPGMPIANVVDMENLKVQLSIAEEQIGKIRLGQQATLKLDSDPGHLFSGKVTAIGAKAETPNGHTYPVEVSINREAGRSLKVGMFARVSILASRAEGVLTISKESLLDGEEGAAVYVVEGGVAHRKQVTLGVTDGQRCQVTGGLKAGDLVVSFGQKGLREGSLVQYR